MNTGKDSAKTEITPLPKERIFLVGASGHAKVVADIVERQGRYDIAFLVDSDLVLKGRQVYGYDVIGSEADLLERREHDCVEAGIAAIGSNSIRTRVGDWIAAQSFSLVSALHPSAQIGRGATIGKGTVVMPGAIINSDSSIGNCVIVNTRASIDHDCVIGDGVHVAAGATLCGTVKVGGGTFICAGATILPNLNIGRNCVIEAGAVVVADVPDLVTVAGCPARPVGQLK